MFERIFGYQAESNMIPGLATVASYDQFVAGVNLFVIDKGEVVVGKRTSSKQLRDQSPILRMKKALTSFFRTEGL